MADTRVRDALTWAAQAWRANTDQPVDAGISPVELTRIEQRAGLAEGVLTSLGDYLYLALGGDPAQAPPFISGATQPPAEDVLALVEACAARTATSAQWAQLGWALNGGAALPPDRAEALAEALVAELPRGIKHCYRHHRIASMRVAGLPSMVGPLVEGIRGCIDNPEGPAFLEPIGMLAQIPSPDSRNLILDLLERPRTPSEGRYAGWLATLVLQRGDFDPAQRARLTMALMMQWRRDPEVVTRDLVELLEELPDGVRQVFLRAQGQELRERDTVPLCDVTDAAADLLKEHLVAAVRDRGLVPSLGGWQGLAAIIEAAYCRANSEIRHLTGQVLSASPYRAALADGLLDLLGLPEVDPLLRRRAAIGVSNLLDSSHRLRLLQLLDDPQEDMVAGLVSALGHIEHSVVSDQELRARLPARHLPLGRPCMYALGMSGSEILPRLAASRSAPRWQRDSARWWLEVGPAVWA